MLPYVPARILQQPLPQKQLRAPTPAETPSTPANRTVFPQLLDPLRGHAIQTWRFSEESLIGIGPKCAIGSSLLRCACSSCSTYFPGRTLNGSRCLFR